MLRGTVEAHYAKIRSYILELSKSDREGRFELHVDAGSVFKALYIGFSGLRKGFKEGCIPVIGLDGAFLKTYLGGILLTAVGTDGNNQMYPIAWPVVEAENEVCWTWFIKIVAEELELGEGVGVTIIRLENAVQSLLPLAEHRNCARHIYANWKKTHKGPLLKQHFWKIVRSTYLEEYEIACRELEKEDGQAYADLMDKNPSRFCKAFLTPGNCSDVILKQNVDDYVHEYYSLRKYMKAYGYGLPALNGEKLWPQAEGYPVVPPPVKKMPGRPKKVRRRDLFEKNPARPNRMKKICVMTCQKCLQEGHNSRTCKNEPVAKMGRPRKTPSLEGSGTTAITGRGGRRGGRGG
ncbi:uncharacterized protein LOC121770266 [Salvia splendens]|uniref:uncharacterized protein LOC121770266 n=1 Tax=Salvia splendens TaxID=180675 RepID=UPI001C251730|nr:uncharacterized protein LOC121770266 [Salvia splendens]